MYMYVYGIYIILLYMPYSNIMDVLQVDSIMTNQMAIIPFTILFGILGKKNHLLSPKIEVIELSRMALQHHKQPNNSR